MKVLHVGVGNLGPGGVRTYLLQIAQGQRERGLNPVVSELFPDPGHEDLLGHSFASVAELVENTKRIQPDVVHLHSQIPSYQGISSRTVLTAHEHSAYCPAGSKFLERQRKECHVPYGTATCIFHHYLDNCGSRHPMSLIRKLQLTRQVVNFPGHWIAPSEYTRSMLTARGLDAARIHLLPNPGPSTHSFAPDPSAIRDEFLFIGRLVPNKGCDVAIRALALQLPSAKLAVLGDGPSRSGLESLCRELRLEDRVEFAGWQPREVVNQRIERCLALVVPSLWPEPFGLVALEAFSRRRPVIASRTGGLQDIVRDGVSGLLVDVGSPEALGHAMQTLLESPSKADTMGSVGATDLEGRFRLSRHLDGLDAIYAKALETRG